MYVPEAPPTIRAKDNYASQRIELFNSMYSARQPYEAVWQDIADNVVPHRTQFNQVRPTNKALINDIKIYDGTPVAALNLYASGSQGYLLSSSYKWFSLRIPDERLMDDRQVRIWLSIVEQVLYGLIQRSNFYKEMYMMFKDGGGLGTATVYTYFDPVTRRAWFNTLHPKEIFIAEDDNGQVNTVARHFTMTARRMYERFKDDTLDPDIIEDAKDDNESGNDHEILHIVQERIDYDARKQDSKNMRYESCYIDMEHESTIREGGFPVNPYGVWRVEKASDEVYGRGPGWTALADIKALYQYVKTDIHAAQLEVDPVLDVPAERLNDIKYVPGGRNSYEDPNRTVKRINPSINLRAGLDREERKQRIIEKHFLVDFFMMMSQAQREMTATEIRQRQEEKAVMLGPHITGLNQDILDKQMDVLFRAAWDNGMIPQPPDILKQAGHIEVDYQGPLAQAQRSFFKTEPYRSVMRDITGMVQAISPVAPGVASGMLDNYNWDYITREMSKGDGLPEEAIMDEKIRDKIRQQRAQQQMAQAQAAQMSQVGKAAPGLNQPVQEGSILAQIAGQAASATGQGQ
jgi:hypothetical protein